MHLIGKVSCVFLLFLTNPMLAKAVTLDEFGAKLDIIYEDGIPLVSTLEYSSLIFWNETISHVANG